jgi:hypothetical protein
MKRLLVVFAAAGAVVTAAATPALADAPPNDNNCLGSIVSHQTPDVVQGGDQGDNATYYAHQYPGGRADFVHDFVEMFCPDL